MCILISGDALILSCIPLQAFKCVTLQSTASSSLTTFMYPCTTTTLCKTAEILLSISRAFKTAVATHAFYRPVPVLFSMLKV